MKTKTEGLIKVCRACIAQGVHTEISLILCDDLEGWNKEGGREAQEGGDMGIYVYV